MWLCKSSATYDLKILEQNGVKGTILYVAADNLGAHPLAGFLESFRSDKFCRFCLASSGDAQQQEVHSGFFQLRDKDSHDRQVQEVREDTTLTQAYGVKRACPWSVAMTLASKHQKAVSYHLDCSAFFKPSVELTGVTPVLLASFPLNVQRVFTQDIAKIDSVLDVSSVCIDGIMYHPDMVLCFGSCSGLSEVAQIEKIVAANTEIMFICHKMTAWYSEHLRSYQLLCGDIPSTHVVKISGLNDVLPLSAYRVQGELMVTLKRYVIC